LVRIWSGTTDWQQLFLTAMSVQAITPRVKQLLTDQKLQHI